MSFLKEKEHKSIKSLIDDCLLEIFKYLPLDDLLSTKEVCQKWEQLSLFSIPNLTEIDLTGYSDKKICNILKNYKLKKLLSITFGSVYSASLFDFVK